MKQFDLRAFKDALRTKGFRPGFVEDRDLPFSIKCDDLSRARLGDERFEADFIERKAWCSHECEGEWDAAPIRDELGQTVGREFRFEDANDATVFFLRFQWPPMVYV